MITGGIPNDDPPVVAAVRTADLGLREQVKEAKLAGAGGTLNCEDHGWLLH
jgi:hypothetical protein